MKAPQPLRASAQLGCSWRPGTWPDLYLRTLLEPACSVPRPIEAMPRAERANHSTLRGQCLGLPSGRSWYQLGLARLGMRRLTVASPRGQGTGDLGCLPQGMRGPFLTRNQRGCQGLFFLESPRGIFWSGQASCSDPPFI